MICVLTFSRMYRLTDKDAFVVNCITFSFTRQTCLLCYFPNIYVLEYNWICVSFLDFLLQTGVIRDSPVARMNSGYYRNEQLDYTKRYARHPNHLAMVEGRPPLYSSADLYMNTGFSTYSVPYGRQGLLDGLDESRTKRVHRKMIDVKPLKNNSVGDLSYGSSQRTESTTSSRNGVSSIFLEYSEKCSLVGVSYIRNAKNSYERAIWTFLLFAAIGVMGLHLQMLFASYFSFGKHTQISLGFNTLDFPAVTFCNVNAMRMSQVIAVNTSIFQLIVDFDVRSLRKDICRNIASDELLKIIQSVSMDNMHKNVKQWSPEFGEPPDRSSNSPPGKMREKNFFDSMPNDNITAPRASVNGFYKKNYPDTWLGQCEQSTFDYLQDTFKEEWVEMNSTDRIAMGHQIQNMLLQCSYDGGQCVMSNFTVSESTSYGNCYTIQNPLWTARRSGPDQGFELILFLETDEYIPGITNAKGIQLVIHEQGTTAFPDDEGIAVAAGTETVIGLRQTNISRMGSPYGKCSSTAEFLEKYKVKYTRTACQKVCEQEMILDTCKCFDQLALQPIAIMNYTGDLPPCSDETQMYCMTAVQWNFTTDNDKCDCNSPCREIQFGKTVSSRQWPSDEFANVMVEMICQENNGSACKNMRENKSNVAITARTKREEFIKLNIYFEDLNYEQYEEAADYELTQFLSDVGGTIGLYIGLSVLGIFELFHLVVDILNYLCCRKGKNTEQMKYG